MSFFAQFAEQLHSSLEHRTIESASEYAGKYRYILPKRGGTVTAPFSFEYYPWLREMHDSQAEFNVGQKSAQMGYTELLLNWVFYKIDIKKQSCLYVLPTDDNASDFSASRFDPAIEASPHLIKLFSNTKNTGHKRSGQASLYIRGSRAKNKLISIPVGNIAIDELDQMVQKHIALIWERMSGQFEKQSWAISTPTVEGYGINKLFVHTTEEHYFFRCPRCNRHEQLLQDNLVICGDHQDDPDVHRSHLICTKCKGVLNHETKPLWLADAKFVEARKHDHRGFYVNQLYSSTVSPVEMARSYLIGQEDEEALREYWNSKMGNCFVPSSYRLNDEDIDGAKGKYTTEKKYTGFHFISMGVDVGTLLNYVIEEWTLDVSAETIEDCHSRVIAYGTVDEFIELDDLIEDYRVTYTVIDANPERRASTAFCKKWAGRARACFYGKEKLDREITLSVTSPTVSVNRATWIDHTIKKIKRYGMLLPVNLDPEITNQLKANIKIIGVDSNGNVTYRYDNLEKPDHYHHALVYAELAARCAFEGGSASDIRKRV